MLDPCLYSFHLDHPRRQQYGHARAALLNARGPATLDAEVAERLAISPDGAAAVQFRGPTALPGTNYALVDLETGQRFPLRTGINTIGRYRENDIVIETNAVSRRHCVILVHASGDCELHDTASRNGTFVNRVQVRATWVLPGSVIKIIRTQFLLDPNGDRSATQVASVDA